jgi:hypothetical protein
MDANGCALWLFASFVLFCGNSADRCAFVTFVAFCGKGALVFNFFSVHGRRPSRALGGVVPLSGGLRRPAILRRPCRDWKSCFADSERLWKSQRAMIRGQKLEVGGQRAVNFVSNFVSNLVGNFIALCRKPQSAPLRVPFAFIRVHSRLESSELRD